MKKTTDSPVKVYSDPAHEEKTKTELEKSRNSLQAVLDVWNSLELVPCADIYALIMNPQKVYGDSVNKLAEPPIQAGRFQVSKSAYIQTLDIPVPEELYRAAKSARQQPFCAGNPELWSVSGDQVVLNDLEAEYLIDSQSIYLSAPVKIQLAEDLKTLVEAMNKVNSAMAGELLPPFPHVYQFCMGKFLLKQQFSNTPFEMSVDPAFLRELIQR